MLLVTGGAGFVGSNLVKQLNDRGESDILVVDDLADGKKFINLADCNIQDYCDATALLEQIEKKADFGKKIKAIFHQGACSVTTEWNGKYMMENNFEYSKKLFHFALENHIPFIYASSAAVYGGNTTFQESREFESPLNVYGYSKMLFDHYVRRFLPKVQSQVVGLRYFNVYGPREAHKGSMASVAFHFTKQIQDSGYVKLFAGCDGYADGEQRRDFIYVKDVVNVNLWFLEHPEKNGIFNVGTGRSQTFNDMAHAVIAWFGNGKISYVPFPENLRGCYQSFTQADISALRACGYTQNFMTVEEGVKEYLNWLEQKKSC